MQVFRAPLVRTHGTQGAITDAVIAVDAQGDIAWVGPFAQIPSNLVGAHWQDLDGVVMPGLVDTHVHLACDGGSDPMRRMREQSDPERVFTMLDSAGKLLSAGVTTARDLGAPNYLDLVVRDAIGRGEAPGPRVLASGFPFTRPGGHAWFMGGEIGEGRSLAEAVERHRERGVDSIKIMASGGFLAEGPESFAPWVAQFSEVELRDAVAVAHASNLPVAVHAHGNDAIRNAVRAGVDSIEHCTFVGPDGSFAFDPELADEIVASGVFVDLTANVNAWRALRDGRSPFHEHVARVARELDSRGARFAVGTDGGINGTPHHAYAATLEVLASFDMSSESVLMAATVGSARSIGLGGRIGALEVGAGADFVVLAVDPVRDITTLRRPTLVVSRGRAIAPAQHPSLEVVASALPKVFGSAGA